MNYIISKELRVWARKQVNAPKNCPVNISDEATSIDLVGEPGGWFTKGGTPITYPNAYAKSGWSNMKYIPSTISVEVPVSEAIKFAERYPKVVCAGRTFYVKKSSLRKAEKYFSKYEKHMLACPEKADEIYLKAITYLRSFRAIGIIFCSIPNSIKVIYNYYSFIDVLKFLGDSPQEITEKLGFKLKRKDAIKWMSQRKWYIDPCRWLVRQHKLPNVVLWLKPEVAYWTIEVFRNPKKREVLEKERTMIGPHGEVLKYKYLSRLDEVKPCDLYNGEQSSVKKVFKRVAERVAKEEIKILNRHKGILLEDPDWYPGDSDEWKLLRTGGEIILEGKTLKHCVAQYIPYVKKGESIIVSIKSSEGSSASTIEFDSEGKVVQHYGFKNSEPMCYAKEVLNRLLNKINEQKEFNKLKQEAA